MPKKNKSSSKPTSLLGKLWAAIKSILNRIASAFRKSKSQEKQQEEDKVQHQRPLDKDQDKNKEKPQDTAETARLIAEARKEAEPHIEAAEKHRFVNARHLTLPLAVQLTVLPQYINNPDEKNVEKVKQWVKELIQKNAEADKAKSVATPTQRPSKS